MKKIIFAVVFMAILVISLVEITSITGQITAKESQLSLVKSTKYFNQYSAQMGNLSSENYVLCQPADKCRGLDKYMEKFNWPEDNYWYVSFYNGTYIMEFIVSKDSVMYQHVGQERIIEVIE